MLQILKCNLQRYIIRISFQVILNFKFRNAASNFQTTIYMKRRKFCMIHKLETSMVTQCRKHKYVDNIWPLNALTLILSKVNQHNVNLQINLKMTSQSLNSTTSFFKYPMKKIELEYFDIGNTIHASEKFTHKRQTVIKIDDPDFDL